MRKTAAVFLLAFFLTGGPALAGGHHIKVTYPDSHCKQWFRGVRYSIKWNKSGIERAPSVNIYLVSGTTSPIALNAANTGFHLWTIPANIPLATYRIRITAFNNRYVGDSVAFKIVDVPPKPHVGAISPASGASLLIGAKYPVRWNSTGIFGQIRISVWQGNSWKGNIYLGNDSHNFTWTVGRLMDTHKWLKPGVYKIRIQAIQDYSVYSDINGVKLSNMNLRRLPRKPHKP